MIPKFNLYKEQWQIQSSPEIKPGLTSMQEAMKVLGHPERAIKVIHVAGTNGKGSTVKMIQQLLLAHGKRVGAFFSPSFVDVHDQIQVGLNDVTEKELNEAFEEISRTNLSGKLTDFELLTCVAFLTFRHANIEVAVIETGMGGLEDSTNVVTPLVSVITSIAKDHERFLGTTLSEIATHKAGIIKSNRPVICGPLQKDAMKVVRDYARENQSDLFVFGNEVPPYHGALSLNGKHQRQNAALALFAVQLLSTSLGFSFQQEVAEQVLATIHMPLRFEKVNDRLYLDGAHNPASIEKLVETIQELGLENNVHFIVGMIQGKDASAMLRSLETVSTTFTFVSFQEERSRKPEELAELSHATYKQVIHNPFEAMTLSLQEENVTIVVGSLYLLAEIYQETIRLFKKSEKTE
ncbi:bifunctional folylpolyglutamate synthase/dihydrofolate synthase [Paenisporosarcina cavernae]|uniref:tetrahydrofolate synthase n=1 Tax=Paenisporosarcina cavernae TaxID=2320858 RepID=A0A385YW54_9BACL|nr:folylpolyglutamate synthase/dihydrofolate synthase family protein [Paenisporosarcina cavernae]AYC29763.1 bifunctional folylpolyglutamate synthase/dihydrofolate synthase [Paenisporosarcina cavernae]